MYRLKSSTTGKYLQIVHDKLDANGKEDRASEFIIERRSWNTIALRTASGQYISATENELGFEANPSSKNVILYIKSQNQVHKLADKSKISIQSIATRQYLTLQDGVIVTDSITKGSIFEVHRTQNGLQLKSMSEKNKYLIFTGNTNATGFSSEEIQELYSYITPIKHGNGVYTFQSAYDPTKKLTILYDGAITTGQDITPFTQVIVSRID